MATDLLEFLQSWYSAHCDGDWEHDFGIEIGTLDNPGWRLEVNLVDTEAEGRRLERRIQERSDHDWIHVWSDGLRFHVAAGPMNLVEVLRAFRAFIEGEEPLPE